MIHTSSESRSEAVLRVSVAAALAAMVVVSSAGCLSSGDAGQPEDGSSPEVTLTTSAQNYMEQLPYNFSPTGDLCPTEADLREHFPKVPELSEIDTGYVGAVDNLIDSYDNGTGSYEGLLDGMSIVECVFKWEEPEPNQFSIRFGVALFEETAIEIVYEEDADFAYKDTAWEMAVYSYLNPEDMGEEGDHYCSLSTAAAQEHLFVHMHGIVYNEGMSEAETMEEVYDFVTPFAQALRES